MALESNLGRIAGELRGARKRGAQRTARDVLELERQLTPIDTGDLVISERIVESDRGDAEYDVIAGGTFGRSRQKMIDYAAKVEETQPYASAAAQNLDPALRVKEEIALIVRRYGV